MYFKYRVGYTDYRDEECSDCGITYGDSYGSAADNVIDAYGDIYELYIKQVTLSEDGRVYGLDDFKFDFKEELGNS